jgi:excisionase family DNA binding protein
LGDSAAHRFRNLGQGTLGGASGSFPFSATKIIEPSPTPFPLSPGNAAPPPLTTSPPVSDMLVADPHLDLPRTYQWNIAVEQSLGSSQSLSVTYIGAVGRDLLRVTNLLNPNANFAFANVTSNSATSDYNTLQVEFQRRLSQGLQALASYTFSHSIDIASTDAFATYLNTPASIANPNIDRGNSDFDIRHSFSAGITYDLPSPESNKIAHAALGGWSVDSFIFARTAPPVDVVGGFVFTDGIALYPRPNVSRGVPLVLYGSQYPGGKAFNSAAFTPPPTGQQGAAAAQLLGNIHVKTLQRYARRGTLPGYRVAGHWYFRATELDAWLRSRINSSCHPCRSN